MDVKLVMFKADGQRKDFPLKAPITAIGRGEECELRVPLGSVSRRHCELILADDSISIKDLGSSNGTYVNNARVNEQILAAGDRIVVGPILFTVQIDGQPEEIEPAAAQSPKSGDAVDIGLADSSLPNSLSEEDSFIDDAPSDEGGSDNQEMDVISALESMASDSDKKKKK